MQGSSAVYHGLARVFSRGGEEQRYAARQLLLRTGVWMPVEVYRHWPVLLPWVIRDNQVAKSKTTAEATGKDLKATAHPATGLERQDNSPVGTMKKGLPVRWASGLSPKLGTKGLADGPLQWMQSHCHSALRGTTDTSTARHPLTNSFIPNLVWLPHAIGRLTDDESLIVKDELRSIAWSRYRDVAVEPTVRATVEAAWSLLEQPGTTPLQRRELDRVNEFVVGPKFLASRLEGLENVRRVLRLLEENRRDEALEEAGTSTYLISLVAAPRGASAALAGHLEQFWRAAPAALHWSAGLAETTSKQASSATAAGGSEQYVVTGPWGMSSALPRSRAALWLVRGLVANGATPGAVRDLLGAAKLRGVDGILADDDLWAALQAAGVPGKRSKWFVKDPIFLDGHTFVLDAGVWTKQYASTTFPKLRDLDPLGRIDYEVLAPSGAVE